MLKIIQTTTLPECVREVLPDKLQQLYARRVLITLASPEERYCYLCNLYFSLKNKPKTKIKGGYYRCRFCKSLEVELVDMQTRRADEATDVFVVCSKCHRRSKV